MSKKSKKKETKKISAKKEKYLKFRKEKPSTLNFTTPELTPEQQKQKQVDEGKINSYLRYNKNAPALSIREKKLSKGRDKKR
jgi:hypothetical protein